MARLAIKIINTVTGTNPFYYGCQDSDQWTRGFDDTRNRLVIPFSQANRSEGANESGIIHTVGIVDDGYVVSIVYIPTSVARKDDNMTVFVHVPFVMDIDNGALYNVISMIEAQITSASGYDKEVLLSIVETDYPERQQPIALPERGTDGMVAIDCTGRLLEYVGQGFFNAAFWRYSEVVLYNHTEWPALPESIPMVSIAPGKLCIVQLPQAAGYDIAVNGVKTTAANMLAPYGALIKVTFTKDAYNPVSRDVSVNDSTVSVNAPRYTELTCRYDILESNVTAIDKITNKPVGDVEILVNERYAVNGKWTIDRDAFVLTVKAPGYSTYTRTLTRHDVKGHRLEVKLKPRPDGGQSTHKDSRGNGKKLWMMVISIVALVMVAAGVIWVCMPPNTNEIQPSGMSNAEMKKYLDGSAEWHIANLKSEDTALYNAIVNADANDLKAKASQYGSKNLQALCDAVNAEGAEAFKANHIKDGVVYVNSLDLCQPEEQEPTELDSTIIAYIDNTPQWRKTEMDAIAPGLYDAINIADMEKILEYAAMPEYKDSKRIQQILAWHEEAKKTWGVHIINPISGKKEASKQMSRDSTLTFKTTVTDKYGNIDNWGYRGGTRVSTQNNLQPLASDTSKSEEQTQSGGGIR